MVVASNSDADLLAAQNFAIEHALGYIMSESYGESAPALRQAGAEGAKILADDERSYGRRATRISRCSFRPATAG